MPTLRRATPDDAATIAAHRHAMFFDNDFATHDHLATMDASFTPWVRERLADGRYVGLFLTDDADPSRILAAAGIHFLDFAPHWMDTEPMRPYLLNFYTAPEARGQGHANTLLRACVDECRRRGAKLVTLHASRFGRPIYEKYGFTPSTEMMLRLGDTPNP